MEAKEKSKRESVCELALESFSCGMNCAESVYDALLRAGVLNAPPDSRIFCLGFGGGVGLCGYTCGALSSAILALNAKFGRPDPWGTDPETRVGQLYAKSYARFNNLVHDFEKENGSALCQDIAGAFKGDWGGAGRQTVCRKAVASGAGLAYDYLTMSAEDVEKLEWGDNMAGMQ